MITPTQPSEPFELSSDLGEQHLPESLTRSPLDSSGRPTGTPFQLRLMDAVTGSEFHESTEFGVAVHRRGQELHIGYDQAMEFLWPPEGNF